MFDRKIGLINLRLKALDGFHLPFLFELAFEFFAVNYGLDQLSRFGFFFDADIKRFYLGQRTLGQSLCLKGINFLPFRLIALRHSCL